MEFLLNPQQIALLHPWQYVFTLSLKSFLEIGKMQVLFLFRNLQLKMTHQTMDQYLYYFFHQIQV